MPECMQHPQYLAGSIAFQYADNLVAGLALGQHQQAAARPGALADYRVHLPEADILAGLHLGRAFLYATVVLVVFGGVLLVLLFLQLVAADRQVQAAQAEVSPVDVSVGRVGGNLRQCHTLQQDLPHRSGGPVMALAYVVLKMGGQLRAELDRAALVQVAHLIGPVLRFLGGVDHIGFRSSVVQLLTQAAQLKLALDAVGSVDGLFIGDVMVEELTDRNGKTEVVNKDSCCIMGAGFLCSLLRHFAPLKIDVAERKNGRLWQSSW